MKNFRLIIANEESGFEYWATEYQTNEEASADFKTACEEYGLTPTENIADGESKQGYHVFIYYGKKSRKIYNHVRSLRSEMRKEMGF